MNPSLGGCRTGRCLAGALTGGKGFPHRSKPGLLFRPAPLVRRCKARFFRRTAAHKHGCRCPSGFGVPLDRLVRGLLARKPGRPLPEWSILRRAPDRRCFSSLNRSRNTAPPFPSLSFRCRLRGGKPAESDAVRVGTPPAGRWRGRRGIAGEGLLAKLSRGSVSGGRGVTPGGKRHTRARKGGGFAFRKAMNRRIVHGNRGSGQAPSGRRGWIL